MKFLPGKLFRIRIISSEAAWGATVPPGGVGVGVIPMGVGVGVWPIGVGVGAVVTVGVGVGVTVVLKKLIWDDWIYVD